MCEFSNHEHEAGIVHNSVFFFSSRHLLFLILALRYRIAVLHMVALAGVSGN